MPKILTEKADLPYWLVNMFPKTKRTPSFKHFSCCMQTMLTVMNTQNLSLPVFKEIINIKYDK